MQVSCSQEPGSPHGWAQQGLTARTYSTTSARSHSPGLQAPPWGQDKARKGNQISKQVSQVTVSRNKARQRYSSGQKQGPWLNCNSRGLEEGTCPASPTSLLPLFPNSLANRSRPVCRPPNPFLGIMGCSRPQQKCWSELGPRTQLLVTSPKTHFHFDQKWPNTILCLCLYNHICALTLWWHHQHNDILIHYD